MNTLALNPAMKAVAVSPMTASAQSAIPYRTAAPISTGSFLTAFAITALVLAALVGCIAYARHRGWLANANMQKRMTRGAGIVVKDTRRVSTSTTAHVVAYKGIEYLVVESGRGFTATVSPLADVPVDQRDAP